jgi:hypothetical protein
VTRGLLVNDRIRIYFNINQERKIKKETFISSGYAGESTDFHVPANASERASEREREEEIIAMLSVSQVVNK